MWPRSFQRVTLGHKQYKTRLGCIRANSSGSGQNNDASSLHIEVPDEFDLLHNPDYQFLQKCRVPTSKFQSSLPRLPIPKLGATLDRYLDSQKPLLTEDQFKATQAIVAKFRNGSGPQLQKELLARDSASKHDSYVCGPLTATRLADRRPLWKHNPGIYVACDPRPGYMNLPVRVTNTLVSALRFHRSLSQEKLDPDVHHVNPAKTDFPKYWKRIRHIPDFLSSYFSIMMNVYPLDMTQYKHLFQSSRIPDVGQDSLVKDANAKHVLIIQGGHFYVFDVLDRDGNLYSPQYLLQCVEHIIDDEIPDNNMSVGTLTSLDRDTWAGYRHQLALDPTNAEHLKMMDTALMCLCLDDWLHCEAKQEEGLANIVLPQNPANRWMDKSFSLVFADNGALGVTYNNSWADSFPISRFVNEVVNDSQLNSYICPDTEPCHVNVSHQVKKLEFSMDDQLKEAVKDAREKYLTARESISWNRLLHTGLGANLCKKAGIEPEAIVQVCLQIAYHRLYLNLVSTFETCLTTAFRKGRTEVVRPTTSTAAAVVEAFNGDLNSKDRANLLRLLRECGEAYYRLSREAALAQGWDRHLDVLKRIAPEQNQGELPEFFTDSSYVNVTKKNIISSKLGSPNMTKAGFCPCVAEGFGVAYHVRENEIDIFMSNYKQNQKGVNGAEFCSVLKEVCDEVADVLASA